MEGENEDEDEDESVLAMALSILESVSLAVPYSTTGARFAMPPALFPRWLVSKMTGSQGERRILVDDGPA
jgi:hypothetical protein